MEKGVLGYEFVPINDIKSTRTKTQMEELKRIAYLED